MKTIPHETVSRAFHVIRIDGQSNKYIRFNTVLGDSSFVFDRAKEQASDFKAAVYSAEARERASQKTEKACS